MPMQALSMKAWPKKHNRLIERKTEQRREKQGDPVVVGWHYLYRKRWWDGRTEGKVILVRGSGLDRPKGSGSCVQGWTELTGSDRGIFS